MKKNKWIKIIVLVCIVLVVAGIWAAKNVDIKESVESSTDRTYENLVAPLNEEDFFLEANAIDLDVLTAYGLPIILDFGADACAPCKKMAPILVKLNDEMHGRAIIKFVDVWKHAQAADGFPIQVIPTQVFINADGTPYVPSEDLNVPLTLYHYRDTNEHAFTVHEGGLTEDQLRSILSDMGVDA